MDIDDINYKELLGPLNKRCFRIIQVSYYGTIIDDQI